MLNKSVLMRIYPNKKGYIWKYIRFIEMEIEVELVQLGLAVPCSNVQVEEQDREYWEYLKQVEEESRLKGVGMYRNYFQDDGQPYQDIDTHNLYEEI